MVQDTRIGEAVPSCWGIPGGLDGVGTLGQEVEAALLAQAEQLGQASSIDLALEIYRVIQLRGREKALEAWMAASDLLFAAQRYAEALEACEQSLAFDPANALLYENRGTILAMLDRHEQALACYELACELAPWSEPLIWANYATTLCVLGREECALPYYEKGLQLDPEPAQAVVILSGKGEALLVLERPAEALHVFSEALRLGQVSLTAGGQFAEELLRHLSGAVARASLHCAG